MLVPPPLFAVVRCKYVIYVLCTAISPIGVQPYEQESIYSGAHPRNVVAVKAAFEQRFNDLKISTIQCLERMKIIKKLSVHMHMTLKEVEDFRQRYVWHFNLLNCVRMLNCLIPQQE